MDTDTGAKSSEAVPQFLDGQMVINNDGGEGSRSNCAGWINAMETRRTSLRDDAGDEDCLTNNELVGFGKSWCKNSGDWLVKKLSHNG